MGDQGRVLRRIIAGWHPRHKDAKLDAAALAKVEALKLMEEADQRHSRVNVRRKKTSAAPEEESPVPQARQGRDCVAMRMANPSAEGEGPTRNAEAAAEHRQQCDGPRGKLLKLTRPDRRGKVRRKRRLRPR